MMGFFVTVALLLSLGFVLSLIAFVRTGSLSSRVKRLEARLSSLENENKIREERACEKTTPENSLKEKERVSPFGMSSVKDASAPFFAPPQETAAPLAPSLVEAVPVAAAMTAAIEPAPAKTEPEALRPLQLPRRESSHANPLKKFIEGGNLWAAGGVVLLTAAFAMFIAYLGRRGFFTVEMGIAAAAFTGLILIVLGWRLRKKRPVYFLILQGGGIGILYLSVFAAHKLTPYFPAPLSLLLLSLLIPPALVLALFQRSQPLAVLGFLGGFAAPILLSEGEGGHVFLFTYYLILSAGVLVIGFLRSWKILKIMSFVCTFGVSLYWVMNFYTAALFPQTEPFFVIFILLYTVLGLGSIKRKVPALGRGGDGFVILGTPLAGALLQWKVFSVVSHGHAFIALASSAFYLALAALLLFLRRDKTVPVRPYIEGYLGLSVFLANIAIPLELSSEITSALWSTEGTVIFFFGLMFNRHKTPGTIPDWKITAAGLLVHIAGAIAFCVGFFHFSPEPSPWRSPEFLGSLIIALSALTMAALTHTVPQGTRKTFVSVFPVIAVIWGLIWWIGGWYFETWRLLDNAEEAFFMLLSLTALGTYGVARIFKSPAFYTGLIPAPAFALFLTIGSYARRLGSFYDLEFHEIFTFTFFAPRWRVGWMLFFVVQILLVFLAVFEKEAGEEEIAEKKHRKKFLGIQIFTVLLILMGTLSPSGRYLTNHLGLSASWISFAGLLPLFAAMLFLSFVYRYSYAHLNGLAKQVKTGEKRLLFVVLPVIISSILGIWFLVTLFMPGDPAPLPVYIPLVNPLDLLEGFCIAVVIFWLLSLRKRKKGEELTVPRKSFIFILADVLVFIWLAAILARSVHFYGAIPFHAVTGTDVFHLGLFIFCALYGIAHIIGGHRLSRRRVWVAGVVLTVAAIAKLILFDMADTAVPYRILSFFIAGVILLFIGWVAPLPPSRRKDKDNHE